MKPLRWLGARWAVITFGLAWPLVATARQEASFLPHPAMQVLPHRPSGAVFATAQTPDGYLWFGTLTGLYRYDGVRFVRFSPENTPALSHQRIYHLAVTIDGRLWIASGHPGPTTGSWERGGPGLVEYKAGVFRRWGADEGLSNDWVMSLAAGLDNKLWVGTKGGLALVHNGRALMMGAPENSDGAVFHVRPDGAGRVWLGASGGFYCFERGHFRLEHARLFPLFSSQATDGTLWMTNIHSVFRLAPAADHWISVVDAQALKLSGLNAVVSDESNGVWIGGAGFAHLDIKSLRLTPQGQPGLHLINSLFRDREGNIWVGTRDNGVLQATPARVFNYGTPEGFPADVGFSVLSRKGGSVLFGFPAALVQASPDSNALNVHRLIFTPHSMTEDPEGQVWIASREPQIYRYHNDQLEPIELTRAGTQAHAETLSIDAKGGLWVSWREGGISHYEADRLRSQAKLGEGRLFTVTDGVCPGGHLSAATGKSSVWFGAYNGGITQLSATSARCHKTGGLAAGSVMGVWEERDGSVFAGVNGINGLFRLRGEDVVRYEQGLQTSVYGLVGDGQGSLWFGSASGVYKLRLSDLDKQSGRIPWLKFSHADGLRGDESMGGTSPAGALDGQGRFWFPTLRGFSGVVDPGQHATLPLLPPVVETVLLDQKKKELPIATAISAPTGSGNLTIAYTSPTFTLPHQLQFSYKLAGFDGDWVHADDRRTAYYTNVPPGKYTFSVRVQRGDEAPVLGQAVLIALQPRFHETWAFYAALALAGLGVVITLHRMRLRRIEHRHALVHTERARLARELHDNLGQGFTAIGFSLDALRSKLNGNAIAPIAERARGFLEHCQTETRRLIWDLRSESERLPDLETALNEVANRARVPNGPEVTFKAEGSTPGFGSGLAQHELPLIAQEAVTNALRHANASKVQIALQVGDDHTTLTITDDGKGFTPHTSSTATPGSGHFGLVGIEERSRRLGAQLRVTSAPEAGTEILVRVPSTLQTSSQSQRK